MNKKMSLVLTVAGTFLLAYTGFTLFIFLSDFIYSWDYDSDKVIIRNESGFPITDIVIYYNKKEIYRFDLIPDKEVRKFPFTQEGSYLTISYHLKGESLQTGFGYIMPSFQAKYSIVIYEDRVYSVESSRSFIPSLFHSRLHTSERIPKSNNPLPAVSTTSNENSGEIEP